MRVVELFAGVGGFNYGLGVASPRFRTVWANQWEPNKTRQHAFDCYRHRFPNTPASNRNITAVPVEDIPSHDLLVGGFPCQDYSVAATQSSGLEGKKGVLWWDIMRIVNHHRPSYLFLENVDRLLKSPTRQRGRDFAVMLHTLMGAGYAVEWRVVNAADYGHVQRRRRVYIVGYRHTTPFHQSTQTPEAIISQVGVHALAHPVHPLSGAEQLTHYRLQKSLLTVSDTFTGQFHNAGYATAGDVYTVKVQPVLSPPRTLGTVLESVPDASPLYDRVGGDDVGKWEWLKGAKRIPRVKPNGDPYTYSEGAVPFPDPVDRPARTVLTSEGSRSRTTHVVEDPTSGRLRTLTAVECERLNEFPDGWTDTGMPDRFRYFVMGNAVVTGVIATVGRVLATG